MLYAIRKLSRIFLQVITVPALFGVHLRESMTPTLYKVLFYEHGNILLLKFSLFNLAVQHERGPRKVKQQSYLNINRAITQRHQEAIEKSSIHSTILHHRDVRGDQQHRFVLKSDICFVLKIPIYLGTFLPHAPLSVQDSGSFQC